MLNEYTLIIEQLLTTCTVSEFRDVYAPSNRARPHRTPDRSLARILPHPRASGATLFLARSPIRRICNTSSPCGKKIDIHTYVQS